MQSISSQATGRTAVGNLPVVNNFRRVIEARDMSLMNKELYQFLNLYCGFIAHYNIHGFRDTYAAPKDFADVFIRHFDRNHRYFCGNYSCHDELYQNTGATKAEGRKGSSLPLTLINTALYLPYLFFNFSVTFYLPWVNSRLDPFLT